MQNRTYLIYRYNKCKYVQMAVKWALVEHLLNQVESILFTFLILVLILIVHVKRRQYLKEWRILKKNEEV